MTILQAVAIRMKWNMLPYGSACQHRNLELEWDDIGNSTGKYVCTACGESVVLQPKHLRWKRYSFHYTRRGKNHDNVLRPLRRTQSTQFTLTKEAAMVSIPKIIGIISFSVVLGLSLSNAAQARMSPGPCADTNRGQPNLLKCDDETLQGIKTIKGEVLRLTAMSFSFIGLTVSKCSCRSKKPPR